MLLQIIGNRSQVTMGVGRLLLTLKKNPRTWNFSWHLQDSREDTRFELAHFRKHRRHTVKKLPSNTATFLSQKPIEKQLPGKEATGNKVSNALGKAVDLAVGAKPKKVTKHFSWFQYIASKVVTVKCFTLITQPLIFVVEFSIRNG